MTIESVYKENKKYVFDNVLRAINNVEDAEELTNDIFIRVFNNFEKYDSRKASPKTWIHRIMKNAIIDYYRKRKENHVSIDTDRSDDETVLNLKNLIKDTNKNALDAMVFKENRSIFLSAINGIDNINERTTGILYFVKNLTYDEISIKRNMPINTVKVHIHRVRKHVQNIIEKNKVIT